MNMKRTAFALCALFCLTSSAWSQSEESAFQEPDGAPASLPEPKGVPRNSRSANIKIVQGFDVGNADYMAVVGMIYTRSGDQSSLPKCTGVLIRPDMALTAAHCVCGSFVPTHIYVGRDPTRIVDGHGYYEIRRGAMRTANGCRPGGVHNLKSGLDLALVKLIKHASGIRTYDIASPDLIDRAQSFRIVGFGATDSNALVYPWRKLRATVQPLSKDCVARAGLSDPSGYGCQTGEKLSPRGKA
jgi:hypothetical protein